MSSGGLYIDTSCLLKLFFLEPESARVAEIVVRDERAIIPIGCYNPAYGVTLSLPAIVGCPGILRILEPAMSTDERQALQLSADTLKSALAHVDGARQSECSARSLMRPSATGFCRATLPVRHAASLPNQTMTTSGQSRRSAIFAT